MTNISECRSLGCITLCLLFSLLVPSASTFEHFNMRQYGSYWHCGNEGSNLHESTVSTICTWFLNVLLNNPLMQVLWFVILFKIPNKIDPSCLDIAWTVLVEYTSLYSCIKLNASQLSFFCFQYLPLLTSIVFFSRKVDELCVFPILNHADDFGKWRWSSLSGFEWGEQTDTLSFNVLT